jgi:endonuclease G, mitochondrial
MKNIIQLFKIFLLINFFVIVSCNQKPNSQNQIQDSEKEKETPNSFNESSTNTFGDFNFLPTSTTNQIIVHDNYTLSYVEDYEQAEWVAYELKKGRYGSQNFERPFFIEDPKVKSGSADWKNYRKSGYDKGHLCPAGDMKFSKEAFDETFFTSNISPQLHHFNDGIWNNLEQKVRYWANKYEGLYVVTGGVLTKGLETIGKEDVAVPVYFYKVLVSKVNGKYKMIGFLLPHEESDKPIYNFVVAVDEIEKKTGIDFFPKLDDTIENQLEKSSSYKEWAF